MMTNQNPMLDDEIVLQPVVCEQVTTSSDILAEYYDPKVRFLKRSGSDSAVPTFDIDKMMNAYKASPSNVVRITIPAMMFSKRRGVQMEVPALWEMGGQNRGGYPRPSWCVIIGSPTGGKINRYDICQVRYPRPDDAEQPTLPSGRHALVSALPGTMFVVAQQVGDRLIALSYKVEDQLPWPTATVENYELPENRTYVVLNCALIAIRQVANIRYNTGAEGWYHKQLTEEEKAGVDRLYMLSQEKLEAPAFHPCNIERFWEAAANSVEHNRHEVDESEDIQYSISEPADFVDVVVETIGAYRKELNATKLPMRALPLAASVQYQLELDGSVIVDVEMPSAIEGRQHVAVRSTFPNTMTELPAPFVAEPTLSWGCTTLEELVAKLSDMPNGYTARNIFTTC